MSEDPVPLDGDVARPDHTGERLRRRARIAARVLAAGVGILVGAFTYRVGTTTPQMGDGITVQAYREINGWATATMIEASSFGPATGSRCGIYHLTHHPMLAGYVGALAQRLGGAPQHALVFGVALATAALLAQLAWRTPWGSLLVSGAITAALLYAPGYSSWLQHPVGHTWSVAAFYFLAGAAMVARPVLPLAVASFAAGWISIDATFVFVGIIAGTLFAAHGVARATWLGALAAIAGFALANALHLLQVWCHFEWRWSEVVRDYFVSEGGETSLMYRVGRIGLVERLSYVATWVPAYGREAVLGEYVRWSQLPFWSIALVAVALQPATAWGRVGVVALLVGMSATAFFAPGLMPMHLHYLPRYVLLAPIGMLIVMAVSVRAGKRTP